MKLLTMTDCWVKDGELNAIEADIQPFSQYDDVDQYPYFNGGDLSIVINEKLPFHQDIINQFNDVVAGKYIYLDGDVLKIKHAIDLPDTTDRVVVTTQLTAYIVDNHTVEIVKEATHLNIEFAELLLKLLNKDISPIRLSADGMITLREPVSFEDMEKFINNDRTNS